MLQEITRMLNQMVGHDYLYLDTAIVAKKTPHTPPINIWALSVSPEGKLYAMDSNEDWYMVEPTDTGADIVISTIYQRVKRLYPLYAKLPNLQTA